MTLRSKVRNYFQRGPVQQGTGSHYQNQSGVNHSSLNNSAGGGANNTGSNLNNNKPKDLARQKTMMTPNKERGGGKRIPDKTKSNPTQPEITLESLAELLKSTNEKLEKELTLSLPTK